MDSECSTIIAINVIINTVKVMRVTGKKTVTFIGIHSDAQ